MEYVIGILALLGLGGLLAFLGLKRKPVVVENKSKIEQVKLDHVKADMYDLNQNLEQDLKEADEKANDAPAPSIAELRAELERVRARRERRERNRRGSKRSE